MIFKCFFLQYELKLTASDNLKENYTTVVIHVKDVNDNPPHFERPTYRTQITEENDRNLPTKVLRVIWPLLKPIFSSFFFIFLSTLWSWYSPSTFYLGDSNGWRQRPTAEFGLLFDRPGYRPGERGEQQIRHQPHERRDLRAEGT